MQRISERGVGFQKIPGNRSQNHRTGISILFHRASASRLYESETKFPQCMNQEWTPSFRYFSPKKLVGFHLRMSLVQNRTGELWQKFMQNRHLIKGSAEEARISLQVYPVDYFADFHPAKTFIKWAAMEVDDFENVPVTMEKIEIPGGLFAVFQYKGSSLDNRIFSFIFQNWLPNSRYDLDQRPHFEILSNEYKNMDPESREQICIPIKPVL
jgi:AraC family transcriptional regulator